MIVTHSGVPAFFNSCEFVCTVAQHGLINRGYTLSDQAWSNRSRKCNGYGFYLGNLKVVLGQLSSRGGVLRRELLAVSAPRSVELHQKGRVLKLISGEERKGERGNGSTFLVLTLSKFSEFSCCNP